MIHSIDSLKNISNTYGLVKAANIGAGGMLFTFFIFTIVIVIILQLRSKGIEAALLVSTLVGLILCALGTYMQLVSLYTTIFYAFCFALSLAYMYLVQWWPAS